jgi:ACS family sodium-dependent inorganic phosphate cotransporter
MWHPRFTLIAFCFSCLALSYMDRWNLSVAAPLLMREFGWNETTMGLLQSVFFYGFTATHLPGGWLADRFGGRTVLGGGVLFWSLATAATPLGAGFAGLATARLALGLGEGVNTPSILSLVARGFPPVERTRATVVSLAGVQSGTLVAMPLSAWIAATYGWRAIFYVYAALGAVWLVLWLGWAARRPLVPAAAEPVPPATAVPWKRILRAPAVWALLATTFVVNWTIWFVHSWLPTYLMQAHGLSLKGSGLAAALPNLAMVAASVAGGGLADRAIARGHAVTRVRKLVLGSGFAGAIVLLLLLPRMHSPATALACLSGALGCFALGATTVVVTSLDLAPRHAGLLVGLQGTAGNVAGIISPVLGGAIVARTGSWDLNFYLIAGLLMLGLVVWTTWASAEPLVEVRPLRS